MQCIFYLGYKPMKKRMRITTLAIIILSSSLVLFTTATQRANATLLFEPIVLAALETIEVIVVNLSRNISEMADDIGVMADRILLMADEIGEMSDHIVHTEELMVAAVSENTASSLILSPVEGTVVYSSIPVQISLSTEKSEYLLFISNQADMSGATNALVQNNDTSIAWSRVTDFATGNKLYIAVKTIETTSNSEFSNTVMLNLN